MGARYRTLMRVGSAEVGGLVEIVEWDEGCDLAWSSVTGVDQRGRWRLRARPDDHTHVELRLAYGVAGAGHPGLGRRAGRGARPCAGTCAARCSSSSARSSTSACAARRRSGAPRAASPVPVPAPARAEADRQARDAAVAQVQDEGAAGPRPRRFGLPHEDVVAGPAS